MSNKNTMTIGAFFTPLSWAKWVVKKNRLFDCWLEGAVVLDPTAGEGSFLEAFISIAAENGVEIQNEMLKRLMGIEIEEEFVANFFSRMESRYGLTFPKENFRNEDYILSKNASKADIVVGNPPWQNFCDLPLHYKESLKPQFFHYHLASNPKDLLLGGSRIDIAALVIAKCLADNMKTKGRAYFFMPLSILLNDSAHKAFRSYRLGSVDFAVKEVYDFRHKSVFDGVAARYGLVTFQRDREQSFPIPYHVFESDRWSRKRAMPMFNPDDPLSIVEDNARSSRAFVAFDKIPLSIRSKPRQGVNTCGANEVFIFDSLVKVDNATACVSNKANRNVELPLKYLFPLVTKENFNQARPVPQRFVLLPYNGTGAKPLEEFEIQNENSLQRYLVSKKTFLQKRKGTLINAWITKGYWWAFLGVGKYSFALHKVMWEAYGRKTFAPKIFSGDDGLCWQGNQSLHAYIPCDDSNGAERICASLQNPFVQHYLSSQLMEGTCNWAQPGRVSKLLEFSDDRLEAASQFLGI